MTEQIEYIRSVYQRPTRMKDRETSFLAPRFRDEKFVCKGFCRFGRLSSVKSYIKCLGTRTGPSVLLAL